MTASVTIDARGLEAKLRRLKSHDIPQAMRHTLNDLAFDTRSRIVTEIRKVFDRPTRIVQKLPRVKPQKTNGALPPELWLTDYFNRSRIGPSFAMLHHIPGGPVTRSRKGMEIRLERMGLIGPDEWLMPGQGMQLDAYGNVLGSVASKMIADIGAYGQYSGDAANTGTGVRTKRAAKRKYVWINTGRVKGIFTRVGTQIVPQMIVVRTTPRYAPRFRFYDVALSYAARRVDYHAARAVEQEIARRNR